MISSEESRLRLIQKFWTETTRNLQAIRANLPHLNQADNRQAVNSMFLAAHTIKGNLGMMQLLDLDLLDLQAPANNLEALMLKVREQEGQADNSLIENLEKNLEQLESHPTFSQYLHES
jgi:chemotaxis protein histidine kinase CheA